MRPNGSQEGMGELCVCLRCGGQISKDGAHIPACGCEGEAQMSPLRSLLLETCDLLSDPKVYPGWLFEKSCGMLQNKASIGNIAEVILCRLLERERNEHKEP
jgi:hypothetical protein